MTSIFFNISFLCMCRDLLNNPDSLDFQRSLPAPETSLLDAHPAKPKVVLPLNAIIIVPSSIHFLAVTLHTIEE